jgi:hypothetical protein
MRRGYLFWGAVLILLGGLLFLQALGIRLPGGGDAMGYFWALLLIMLGVWVVVGVFSDGSSGEEQVSIDLGAAREAALQLHHGAGHLTVASGAGTAQLLSGRCTGGVRYRPEVKRDRLDVRMRPEPTPFPFFGSWRGMEWDLQLNNQIPLSLDLDTGASQVRLDLRELQVGQLRLHTGASSIDLDLPASTSFTKVEIELGAASLDMRVPEGVAAIVRVQQGASAIEVDTTRFPHQNGHYQSADYETATHRVDIDIQAGAGRVSVR